MQEQSSIAVFIDADNAPAVKFPEVLTALAEYGTVNIRRAYGNWKNPQLAPWESLLHEFAIQPIQQFDLTKGKNASDMALLIDVMDTLYTKPIDVFCLVSSDCDFTPLVMRLVNDGKYVIGFGERKTPTALVNSCSRFLYLDEQKQDTKPDAESNRHRSLNQDTKLILLLRKAIETVEEDQGWARLGPVGTHISNHASFDQRNYGFKKLSDLFAAIDLFEIKKTKSTLWVRDKKRKQHASLKSV